MGLQIESGEGNSFIAGVNSENRLKVASVSETREHILNHEFGVVYSYGVETTPTSAGNCFLYIKNNDARDMIVSEFMLSVDTNETITIKLGDSGTPIGGSTGTFQNRNAGSGNDASVTSLYGTNITGLDGGNPVMSVFLKGGESGKYIRPLSAFIIPQNKVITGYITTGAIGIKLGMGVSFSKEC